jgi:uncharacterized protein (DUF2461 family)
MLLMASTGLFAGFSPELPRFLGMLRDNNSREWFGTHRSEYENFLLGPAREFVVAIGELLRSRLDLWFWQGDSGPSRDRPAFFFDSRLNR